MGKHQRKQTFKRKYPEYDSSDASEDDVPKPIPPIRAIDFCVMDWIKWFGPNGSGDHPSHTHIYKTMKERYNQVTSIGDYDGYQPLSYCYHEDGMKVRPEDYLPIIHQPGTDAALRPFLPAEDLDVWKSLPHKKKQKLLAFLSSFTWLFDAVEYRPEAGSWHERTTCNSGQQPIDRLNLENYGQPDPGGKKFFELLHGETMVKETFFDSSDLIHYANFIELWKKALLYGMTNGKARTAIMKTLEVVADLLYSLPESVAPEHCFPLEIGHISSPTPSDSFNISISDSGTKSLTRTSCSSDVSSDTNERNSEKNAANCENQGQTLDCAAHKTPEREGCKSKEKRVSSNGLPKHSQHYVDLEVICINKQRAEGKYIFLIEIFSHGKTYNCALGKFQEKLVHVLQSQSEVFGIVLSDTRFEMLRAYRSFKNGCITILSKPYHLHSDRSKGTTNTLNVKVFQTFVMDILSCSVYGMSQIEA